MGVIWGIEIFGLLLEFYGEGGYIVLIVLIVGLVFFFGVLYNVFKYSVVVLLEGLWFEFVFWGIDVFVFCFGFICINIVELVWNCLDWYVNLVFSDFFEVELEMIKIVRGCIVSGIDFKYVGDLVCEGIEKNWGYIFIDVEFEFIIEKRFVDIKIGFD